MAHFKPEKGRRYTTDDRPPLARLLVIADWPYDNQIRRVCYWDSDGWRMFTGALDGLGIYVDVDPPETWTPLWPLEYVEVRDIPRPPGMKEEA